MILLYNKENTLYVKCLMNLRLKISYLGKTFNNNKESVEYLLPEEVSHILLYNGNLKIWDGNKYIKLNLGEFHEVVQHKNYKIEQYPEVKEEPKNVIKAEEVVKQNPVQDKPKVHEVKEEPKVNVKKEENKQDNKQHQNEKKQRHNKQQGGDK